MEKSDLQQRIEAIPFKKKMYLDKINDLFCLIDTETNEILFSSLEEDDLVTAAAHVFKCAIDRKSQRPVHKDKPNV